MLFQILIKEPAILIITFVFVIFIFLILKNYIYVMKNLKEIYTTLISISKNELTYRFDELDEFMTSNQYTASIWIDFKNILVFSDKLYKLSQDNELSNNTKPDIYLTVDASYFFNADTLITSKINSNFIQIMPTILTGFGPFFTFLKMALAFMTLDFSLDSNVASSLSVLMQNIQVAALCSVFAVGYTLIFMFIEKFMYNRMCKKYQILIQKEFIRLFDIVTSERFLMDLIKEAKNQNATSEKMLKNLPVEFAELIGKEIKNNTTPYLENILYQLSKLNENIKNNGSNGDIVDKLF